MANLSEIAHIWQVVVESNTFNFLVFVLLFSLIFKKINVKGVIESIQQKIVEAVEAARAARESAHEELKTVNKSVENLENEIKIIIEDAEKSAALIGEKILEDAKKQVNSIEQNTLKVINAEGRMIISKLTHSASKASVEVAKTHMKNILEQNPALHVKYINESIDSLDRLNF